MAVRLATAAALAVVSAVVTLSPSTIAAHGTPEDTPSHSLTVVAGFPDAGLAPEEQLCLALFAGEDADLAAPLHTECLLSGTTSVTFGGLGHGAFRVAVPAPGSTLTEDRYEGRLAETEVPDDPEVDSYVIDLPLTLLGEIAGTSGTVDVNAFVCPPRTGGGEDPGAWSAGCPNRADGIVFSLASDGSLSGTVANAVTDPAGDAVFGDLAAGTYVLTEAPLANVAADVAWFVTSSFDGTTYPLAPGAPLSLRPAEVLVVDVYHVLLDEVTPAPEPTVPVEGTVTAEAALVTGREPATPTPIDVNVGPVVSTGGAVVREPNVAPSRKDARPRITTLPSTGVGTEAGTMSGVIGTALAAVVVAVWTAAVWASFPCDRRRRRCAGNGPELGPDR